MSDGKLLRWLLGFCGRLKRFLYLAGLCRTGELGGGKRTCFWRKASSFLGFLGVTGEILYF